MKCGQYYLLASTGRSEISAPPDALMKFDYCFLSYAPIKKALNFRFCHYAFRAGEADWALCNRWCKSKMSSDAGLTDGN